MHPRRGTRRWRRGRTVYTIAVRLVLPFLFLAATSSFAETRIGLLLDGPWESNEENIARFTREITDLTRGEFDVSFPPESRIVADWTPDSVEAGFSRLLEDDTVDMVIGAGPLSSHAIATRGDLSKPCFAPFILDRRLQGLPFESGASGVRNLSYVQPTTEAGTDTRAFQEIVPFSTMTILISEAVLALVPDLEASIAVAGREVGVESRVIPVRGTASEALAALPENVEAVYITPVPQLAPGELDSLIVGLNRRRIPTFAFLGRPVVEAGVLAGLKPEGYLDRIARRVALNIQSTLLGDDPATLPVTFPLQSRLVINMATARQIGVSPPFTVLTEAELINDVRSRVDRVVSLADVVAEAMARNLDLAAKERQVAAQQQNIGLTRASLLPQIGIGAAGTVIDQDRARVSFGNSPERSLTGRAGFSQGIYVDRNWADNAIARHSQRAIELNRDALRLDIVLDAAASYLNVLITKAAERIVRNNLELTRSNLELAQVRQNIGISSPADVYRWESEIARGRLEVVEAIAARNVTEIDVNRLLDRPIEESFLTIETTLTDPYLITSDPRLPQYMSDPWTFKVFRRFAVVRGFANSPELRELDALIAAQERELSANTRTFYIPDFLLQGEVDHFLWKDGEGTEALPGVELDDTRWSLSLVADFPLFTSGGRPAGRRQAKATLEELRVQRRAVANIVEQRVRATMHIAGASYAGISLTRAAADAANRNRDLVTDSYARGVATIITLLDAQNAALQADLAAENAVYLFLQDLMEVERAIGGFTFFATSETVDEVFDALEQFRQQADVDR